MNKKSNIKKLDMIFDELEAAKKSHLELDKNLLEIGVNPNDLVKTGLKKINNLLNRKIEDSKTIHLPNYDANLLAASKKEEELDSLKSKLNKKN